MIEWVEFENFRGLKKMDLLDMKPITLISGKNNAGKSSVLEGIFLFLDHMVPDSFIKINRFRGLVSSADTPNLWETAFYQMNMQNILRISVTYAGVPAVLEYERDNGFVPSVDRTVSQELMGQIITSAASAYTLKFHYERDGYVEDGHFIVGPMGVVRNMSAPISSNMGSVVPFAQFINAAIISGNSDNFIAEWLGKIELAGRKQYIIETLKYIEPAIDDLMTIVVNGNAQIFAKVGSQLLPFRLVGDGLNKLLFIVLSIVVNPDSIILIDEVETGFHYAMYSQLWKIIAQSAYENNCQIIVTTHSYECIVGAVDGIEKAGRSSAFCYYRLAKNNLGNQVYRYLDDLLQAAIAADMEVR